MSVADMRWCTATFQPDYGTLAPEARITLWACNPSPESVGIG